MAVGCAGGVSTGEGGELDVAGDCSDGKIREIGGGDGSVVVGCCK